MSKTTIDKDKELVLEFDPHTIEHLGINQYSTLPPVIAELVANSYDADSTKVIINLKDKLKKEIIIVDNGHGMTFRQLNDKFLMIGRNRRKSEKTQLSESGKRAVIGKKGIGKLSFFGISNKVIVSTVRNKLKNVFELNFDELLKAGELKKPYKPKIIRKNEKTSDKPGTSVRILEIKRKAAFNSDDISYSLSNYFQIFDEPDFDVTILHNNGRPFKITNSLRYKYIKKRFSWKIPLNYATASTKLKEKYKYKKDIEGEIISAKETVLSKLNGIALYSRGKLVNEHSFFDVNASSHGYKYLTGRLNIDFIDDWDKEVISTNRKSLNWEDEDTIELKSFLNSLILYIYNEQRKKLEKDKKKEIEETIGQDLKIWLKTLPPHDSKLANKIINTIIKSEDINREKAGELIGFVKDSFQFESFKEFAADMDKVKNIKSEQLISLLKEWKLIEAREFYKLAKVRVETIKKFESYIKQNAKEVPTLRNFLKEFPWLLDPRIMNFRDEVTYSSLLKEHFNEKNIKEENKRIDFLCVDFAESFFIIELKRPKTTIGAKELTQANEYVSFIRNRLGNEKHRNVSCYIIGEKISNKDSTKQTAEAYRNNGLVYFKPYNELLEKAKKYHQEFIDKYDEMNK